MTTLKKVSFLAVPAVLAILALSGSPAKAYYGQNYNYSPMNYGYNSYNNNYNYQPHYFYQPPIYYPVYPPQNYSSPDYVRALTQSNINFVSQFVYIPQPVNYYYPYNYGYGNYGYGY